MLHITTTWIILVRGCGLLDDVVMFAAMKAVLKCDVMYPMQLFYVMPLDVSAKVMRWYLCEAHTGILKMHSPSCEEGHRCTGRPNVRHFARLYWTPENTNYYAATV